LQNGKRDQFGFDIQLTLRDGTRVFVECKKRQSVFRGSELENAVTKFLNGYGPKFADHFWLITTGESPSDLTAAKIDAEIRCQTQSVTFEYNDREALWHRLIRYPHVVRKHLGPYWGDISSEDAGRREEERRERLRRAEAARTYATDELDRYDDGYVTVEFHLPTRDSPGVTLFVRFKTDNLSGAMITLSNDAVLDLFDETLWPQGHPFLCGREGKAMWLQIGNVRCKVEEHIVVALEHRIRQVCQRWEERVDELDRQWEADRYQIEDTNLVKIGRIRADMWDEMRAFAREHDSSTGNSAWHIFDGNSSGLAVLSGQTAEMDAGWHVVLSIRPSSANGTEHADLIWHAPLKTWNGSIARGPRRYWGCSTTMSWLREAFIPLLIERDWPLIDTRSVFDRLIGRPLNGSYRLSVDSVVYECRASDWSSRTVGDSDTLLMLVRELQRHFALRAEARFDGEFLARADRALQITLERAELPYYGYVASRGELGDALPAGEPTKQELLAELARRSAAFQASTSGSQLEWRLRSVIESVAAGTTTLNTAECRYAAETLAPLATAATRYNRLLAHRRKPYHLYPV
jgi:hypothetical protein